MARRGRFGRLPRQVPSLTATIVSIAREMQNLKDQNYVTAWEKGGDVEGKQVTDEMLLEHLRQRRDGVSPDDPLWDYYDNLLQNYSFSIAESKMTLKYANHQVNETAMSAFYKEWAAKLPQDSEAYRNLMRSAAQYIDIAKSRGASGAAAARQAAYAAAYGANYDRYQKGYDTTTMYVAAALLRDGVITQKEYDQIVTAATGAGAGANVADVLNTTELDQAAVFRALDRLNHDPALASLKAQWQAAMGTKGDLTYDGWIAMGADKQKGLDNSIAISTKYGDKSGAQDAKDASRSFTAWRLANNDIDVVADYSREKARVTNLLQNPDLSPGEIVAIADGFRAYLKNLLGKSESDWVKASLEKEIDAWDGKAEGFDAKTGAVTGGHLSLTESATGNTTAEANAQSGDLATTAETVFNARQRQALIDSGQAVYVPNKDAAKPGQPQYLLTSNTGPVDPAKAVVLHITVDGRTIPVVAPVYDITAEAGTQVDPRTGRATSGGNLAPGMDSLIGKYVVMPDGRKAYGIYTKGPNGESVLKWYSSNPFVNDPSQFNVHDDGKGGLTITIISKDGSAVDPTSAIAGPYLDPTLMNSHRFDDPATAMMIGEFTDPPDKATGLIPAPTVGRWDLIHANLKDVATYYAATYGDTQVQITDANGNPVVVKQSDLLTSQFKDAQVTAAALTSDPYLLQRNAAASVGERFWGDYERAFMHGGAAGRIQMEELLAQTPVAQAELARQRALDAQKQALGNLPGYAAASKASPTGLVETIDENTARQRAIEAINKAMNPRTSMAALQAVKEAPVIQLPSLIQQYTGQNVPWVVQQTAPEVFMPGPPLWTGKGVGTRQAAGAITSPFPPPPSAPPPKPYAPPPPPKAFDLKTGVTTPPPPPIQTPKVAPLQLPPGLPGSKFSGKALPVP